jgi:hypothetical protein
MYIFVLVLTPTTESPAAHVGFIIEPCIESAAKTGWVAKTRALAKKRAIKPFT